MKIMLLKKKYVTLIEMMIVMFLIALIIGVVGYNYRGSLEEGKAFKTKAGMEKIATILNLSVAENSESLNDLSTKWEDIIRTSPLVSDTNSLIRDGWGQKYEVTVENGKVVVRSPKYEEYTKSNPTLFGSEGNK